MSKLIHIRPSDRNPAYDAFNIAPATLCGNLLLTSGLIGLLPDGSMAVTLEEQIELIFDQLRSILTEVGGDFSNIASIETFHPPEPPVLDQMRVFMAARDRHIVGSGPAWTSLGINSFAMPGTLIEVKVTAFI